ncbi:glycosyltransferase [Candidatus Bathyarchaeota archaeon]|nr:MAG: glycosyltransferase [Candidatus Bathyarchaeota archaeon]
MSSESTIVVCAHNEADYIRLCLESLVAQTLRPTLIIVVADRCTDGTISVARDVLNGTNSTIIEKKARSWRYSISESLEIARHRAVGDGLVVVDADMTVPRNFLERLLPQLTQYASVSAFARTDPTQGLLNRVVLVWERTFSFAPLGQQPRGGARAISSKSLEKIGGFRDVQAWDSDIDQRFRVMGFKVKLDRRLVVLHRRKMTLRRSIHYQIQMGRARRELKVSLARTVLHALVRLRPFVIYGYLKEVNQGGTRDK